MLNRLLYVLLSRSQSAVYKIYRRAWTFIAGLLLAEYCVGYLVMHLAGEENLLSTYTYWFIVTLSTVGYGDFSPQTTIGQYASIQIILVGIGVFTLFLAKITESFLTVIGRRKKGLSKMNHEGHTVIMGYRKGNTEKIVAEMNANNPKEKVVLCSSDLEENPFDEVSAEFVRGELASQDVLNRANISRARKVIVFGSDDNQTFFTAYAIREANMNAHLVCYLQNEEHSNKIYSLPAAEKHLNQVILPVNVYLLAQELQDPESSNVFQHLISNFEGATLYRVDIPNTVDQVFSFESLFLKFKREFDSTLLALKKSEIISNPALEENVTGGDALFYIGSKRLDVINWSS